MAENDMLARLIELLKKADKNASDKFIMDYEDVVADIAEYLIAHGVLVPPCKVGGTVYSFCDDFGVVLPYFVETLRIGFMDKDRNYWCYEANCHTDETDELLDEIDFDIDDLGKTIFLTREEAEKALSERR